MARNNTALVGSNILISRFSALGDIALAIPVVYQLAERYPDSQFYFITRPHPARLFLNAPENLHVIPLDLDNYKGASGMLRLAVRLCNEYKIDTYVDLHDVLRTKLLRLCMRLLRVRVVKINKGRREKHQLVRNRQKLLVQLKPTAERYADAFKRAGMMMALSSAGINAGFHSIFKNDKGDPEEFKSVSLPKKEEEYWLAVAPFAQHRGKIYPLSLMQKVIDHFANRNNTRIFIFGFGSDESDKIESLAKKRPNVINMAAKKIGLKAELSLLSHCNAMLSMDSANMHMASLVGVRAVSIWGATHPYAGFMGWNQNIADAVQLDMTCRPCSIYGNRPCARGDWYCLEGINPQMIIQRLQTPSDKP